MKKILLPGLLLACAQAHASEDAFNWKLEGELGGVFTSGNTETSSLNTAITLKTGWKKFIARNSLQALYKKENGITSAKRLQYDSRIERKLSSRNAVFYSSQLLRDDFAGFERQDSFLLGYRHSWDWGKHDLQVRPAAGYRISTPQGSNSNQDEAIVSLGVDYQWQWSKTAILENQFKTDWGESNIHSSNTLSVSAQLVEKLSLKVSLALDNNSEVEPGRKNLDSTTSINLVYQLH